MSKSYRGNDPRKHNATTKTRARRGRINDTGQRNAHTAPALRSYAVRAIVCEPGEVVLAGVDYQDGTGRKVRPVVIINSEGHGRGRRYQALELRSSAVRRGYATTSEMRIDLTHAGLPSDASIVYVARIVELGPTDINERRGWITNADLATVTSAARVVAPRREAFLNRHTPQSEVA